MQDLGPGMDDLFRKASEGYPLKPGRDNWQQIEPGILEPDAVKKRKKENHRKYLATILVLLLFIFLGLFLWAPNRIKSNPGIEETGKKSNAVEQVTPGAISNPVSGNKIINEKIFPLFKRRIPPARQSNPREDLRFENAIHANNSDINNTREPDGLVEMKDPKHYRSGLTVREETSAASLEITVIHVDSRMKNFLLPSLLTKESKPSVLVPQKGFYYGILFGPGFNAVRSQGLKKTGFDIGLLGGFRINQNISVETGVVFSKKYYHTNGKYFNMTEMGASMPSGMKVMYVEGGSSIIEIPIHIQYDLVNNSRYRLFPSIGFSSYIMTEENNNYSIEMNGVEQKMIGLYEKDRRYPAASLDLAAGFEKKFGKNNRIRISPYIQVPIKGIGIGRLPVMSTGLHIGITRTAQ